jgi:hypothetical protein
MLGRGRVNEKIAINHGKQTKGRWYDRLPILGGDSGGGGRGRRGGGGLEYTPR